MGFKFRGLLFIALVLGITFGSFLWTNIISPEVYVDLALEQFTAASDQNSEALRLFNKIQGPHLIFPLVCFIGLVCFFPEVKYFCQWVWSNIQDMW